MPIVHRSKIDTWLLVLVVFAMGAAAFGAISAIAAGGPGLWWAVLLPAVVGIGLPFWVLTSTTYTLDDDILLVRSGPFRWKVPVHEIASITPTSNPLSSPALSLDRLRINYGDGRSIMVSPQDKEKFIRDIEAAQGTRYSTR
jgi:hypothetical protein